MFPGRSVNDVSMYRYWPRVLQVAQPMLTAHNRPGLKTGFTFSANMFGAIFGYALVMLMSKTAIPILGGFFGPQENSIIQAAATGAGGMSGIFVAGVPAMYQLKLLSDNPKDDFGRLLTITFVCALFGLFAAVPLRKFFIINVARELNLVFPSRKLLSATPIFSFPL